MRKKKSLKSSIGNELIIKFIPNLEFRLNQKLLKICKPGNYAFTDKVIL